MLFRKPRVGQAIGSYCGKCKMEREHTVAAMDGDIVRRVTCSMCGSTHNYKPSDPVTKSAKPATTARATRGTGTRTRSPRSSQAFSIDPSRPVKSYDMNTNFSMGDVIRHPKFGLGAVETLFPPNKIEVRFEEGRKLLLHNMKNLRP